ncbi:uncharacterized protein LOC135211022 [Macrobrachium nipponense]|uniref:uncharacterized protein LOC135211022 n=1 Tax=Macrobrachium nipponense TaxID=159736 RepID=UPI0030C7F752
MKIQLSQKMTFLKNILPLLLLLTLNSVSSINTSVENNQRLLCKSDTTDNEEIMTQCSCFLNNDTIILQDTSIRYKNETVYLENSTTHWRLSDCAVVHLSGPTLLSLSNLHTLQLHNIKELHIANTFLAQYSAKLQILEIYNSSLVNSASSINIHAHNFKKITLDNMYLRGTFNLLINTEENKTLDLITIQHNQISELGEINISSRQVHEFLLENNNIGSIMTGAILHNSDTTTIYGNTFGNMSLLSLDVSTRNFTLKGNTIKEFRQSAIRIYDASFIEISENVFSHIGENSFIDLRTVLNNGSFSFTYNHFYTYESGSLQFYHTIYNKDLTINHNAIHVPVCDCKALQSIENMTEAHNKSMMDFKQQRYMTYELLQESSACVNNDGVENSMMILCIEAESNISWVSLIAGITGLIIMISFIIFLMQRKQNCIKKLPTKNKVSVPYDYSVNFGYLDDSENEEYVRK